MTIFSYTALNASVVTVSTDKLPWRGAWSSGGAYVAGDWVTYAGDNYIALAANTNTIPNGAPSFWSLLVAREVVPEAVVTDQVYNSTTIVNPNGTLTPADVTVGNVFYHEANGSVDTAWWWSTKTSFWFQPPTAVAVGTVPYSTNVGGSITYDFRGPAYQVTTTDGNLHVSVANMQEGREIAILLKPGAATSSLVFPAEFTWFGTTAPLSVMSKSVLVALTSFGTNLAGVIAATSASV